VLDDFHQGYAKLGNFEIFDKLSQFPTTGVGSSPIEDLDWCAHTRQRCCEENRSPPIGSRPEGMLFRIMP